MRILITTLATAMILVSGSIAWKAEAATVGGLPPLTKTYAPIERVDSSQLYNHPYQPYNGYNGYGHRPYGYYSYSYRPFGFYGRPYGYYGYGYRPYGYGYGRRY